MHVAAGTCRAMPSSIARLAATDHERLLRLIRRACAPGPSQQRWRDELAHLLRAHLAAESDTLRPDVLSAASHRAVAAKPGLEAVNEQLVTTLEQLESTPLDGEQMDGAGDRLTGALRRHAEVLADEVLAPMTEHLPRKQMRELGGRYAEVRDSTLRAEGADEPPPRRLDISRAELYELAKRAGIEGRSSMSRRDLIQELQRRQQTS